MSAAPSFIMLGIGLAFGGLVAWRLRTGVSYDTNPPARVYRASDPFSFWLSLLLPGAAAVVLIALGVAGLVARGHVR